MNAWIFLPPAGMEAMISMQGRTAIVFGVANKRSIAWAIAQKLAAAGNVGHQRRLVALDLLEHDDGAAPCPVKLEQHRGGFEPGIDLVADAQEFVGIFGFDHAQEAAQALIVDICKHGHAISAEPNGYLIASSDRMARAV